MHLTTQQSKMTFLSVFILILSSGFMLSAQPQLSVDMNKKGVSISPTHYGVFFEDINHAADGGLYAELLRNRSFEDGDTPAPWALSNIGGAVSTMSIETEGLLNQSQKKALKVQITAIPNESSRPRIINRGFWGIDIKKGETYKVSFYAKCDTTFKGEVTVSLESIIYQQFAKVTITGIDQEWKKFTCELKPDADYQNVLFELTPTSKGTVWFDVVSMFPPTFKNRENGLRPDLARKIADLH
ncbi:MAG TPA: carbohydrate binding domain-containing protein, partial [Bacteroidales bacterium]|nr:carbohydrate binding domain-containing protein [Bacteroidales bacterium]